MSAWTAVQAPPATRSSRPAVIVLSSTGIGDVAIGEVVAMYEDKHIAPGRGQLNPAVDAPRRGRPVGYFVGVPPLLQAQHIGHDVAQIIVGNDDVGHSAV